jgi:selenocysteine-specific elongation factor
MKPIVLGTAGHIDHGKTTLIKALTGVDCDRLKEEKERGITIELGFTSLTLPSGLIVSIVDVPGHERFIHHMVAGVQGIDLVALVIAADEGIMPQTREHLDICRLLRVKKGLVVLSKIDLVEKEWVDLVQEEIGEFVKGTFLEGTPIVPLSAVTGEGIPRLLSALDRLAAEVEERSSEGIFRQPIDRVFTMKGFGTVVTGTIISGKVAAGDLLEILPQGMEAKVRGIQVHGRPVEMALAGMRAGINLQGIEKAAIERGNVLVAAKHLQVTDTLNAVFQLLPSATKPLRNRMRIRLHIGTAELIGRIILLDREEMKPGEEGYIQIRLEEPTVALPGDRFVLRTYSPLYTIGGGEILDAFPPRHRRRSLDLQNALQILEKGTEEEKLTLRLRSAGPPGLTFDELLMRTNAEPNRLKTWIDRLLAKGEIQAYVGEKVRYLDRETMDRLMKFILDYLKEFHRKNPLQPGAMAEEIKSKLPAKVDARLFAHLLSLLTGGKKIAVEREWVRLPSHRVTLKEDEKNLRERLLLRFQEAKLQPPTVKELTQGLGVSEGEIRPLLQVLVKEGHIVKVKDDLYFHRRAIDELSTQLTSFLSAHKEISPTQFKELTQVSRKFAIPLLEYFDGIKLTLRIGDKRVLRK